MNFINFFIDFIHYFDFYVDFINNIIDFVIYLTGKTKKARDFRALLFFSFYEKLSK